MVAPLPAGVRAANSGIPASNRSVRPQLARNIGRLLQSPAEAFAAPSAVAAPPGAPIGDPGMDWLGGLEPVCSWWDEWQW